MEKLRLYLSCEAEDGDNSKITTFQETQQNCFLEVCYKKIEIFLYSFTHDGMSHMLTEIDFISYQSVLPRFQFHIFYKNKHNRRQVDLSHSIGKIWRQVDVLNRKGVISHILEFADMLTYPN